MANWFGSMDLAYKYALIFGSLLVLTILAGALKVWYNHHRLKKHTKEAALEAGQKEDQMELNQREKDEGDLFGVRAIEAGFFAGIPQSRPTSRAGSVIDSPAMSSSTLVGGGGLNSPKLPTHSVASSITTLPPTHLNNRDSETLPSGSPPRRKSPPTIRLAPSDAELSGRMNHGGANNSNTAVNMNLSVPPSPVLARGPSSPTFGGSDSGDSDGQASPRSLSPRSANFSNRADHYAPVPPQIPMPHGLRVSYHSAESTSKSQAASFNDTSPGHSPEGSVPPSPSNPPESKLPSMPTRALRDEPRSLFPAYSEPRPTLPKVEVPQVRAPESNPEPESPIRPLPETHKPTHQRDMSDASSVYSNHNRISTHQHNRSNSTDFSYNYSFPENSRRNSTATKEQGRRPSASSSLLAPGSTASKETGQTHDPRLSEFYDAYYRHSQLGVAIKSEPKRPNQLNLTQATIVEVPSPQPSPNPTGSKTQPGMAI